MSLWKWSRTAANNATADGSINWAEGQAPSSVNDSARAMMAAAAKFRDDVSGAITTGGASTAYTVSTYQSFDTLAHLDGQMIAFVPHITSAGSAGSQITLAVDGLTAKPIRFAPSLEIPSGTLIQGTPYVVTYNNSDGAFYLQGIGSANPYNVPLGGMIEYTGTTAPNSSFVLPFGQAISRTIYATYFSLVGTTYGVGDGSFTFNVIDKRGRLSAGKDDMGGSPANRITNSGSGITGTNLGATGGAETVTLSRTNLPQIDLVGDGTLTITLNSGTAVYGGLNNSGSFSSGGTGSVLNATQITAAASGHLYLTGAANPAQTATNKMPPTAIVNYLLRVI
jgi:microcystin-dependent protein